MGSVVLKMAESVVYLWNVLLFFVFYVYLLDNTLAENIGHVKPSAEFSRHTLVKPKIYHGREKRQISSTNNGKIGLDFLTVKYNVGTTRSHILDLRLNRDLLPKGYFRRYQRNGTSVVDRPTLDEVDLCHYTGNVRGIPNSWVAVDTCDGGVRGVIYDGRELHHIEKATPNEDNHFLYKHSDVVHSTNKSCGYENAHQSMRSSGGKVVPKRFKRAIENGHIRGPYNANKLSRYVELVLVVDNREYKALDENLQKVYQHCKAIANIINGLYSSLNIFIALVGVEVWTEHDQIELSTNGDTTLTNFLHYRRRVLIKEHPNDNAQLLTKFTFDRGVVGKALKGPICTFEYSGGVSMDHSNVISLVATTVAHEMGHNFGMEHDTNDCECPDDRCIMAPSSSASSPTHWSSCSLEYLALAFEHGMDYCLRNKPLSLFDSPVCGNGFVEPGEQCDCGLPQVCDNTCCNATTCMLFSNASCATGECCNLKTCRPKSAGFLCRAAEYECDLPEYCTGQSEYCPSDIYKMDTEPCDDGKAFCYRGSCRTRSDQCKLLWGNTGKSSDDQCYAMNIKGSRHGNCGYHRVNQSFIKCEDENILCGMLHCRHLNERLEFGMESVAILSQSFINLKGSIIPCRTAIVDLGLNQVDPGLAPDGASCGEGKMCVNQKCMSVENLRAMKNKCPQDCNGNGLCNSLGHCHCKDGFSPPFCDYPGPGGSEDSGPASDPNARKEFVMALYIVFLGIVPIIAIVAFLMYYTKYNVNFKWQKTPSTNKPLKPAAKSRNCPFSSSENNKRLDDDSSLLQDHQPNYQNEFFGQFKGFKLSPIANEESKQAIPIRSVPAVPSVPIIPNVQIKNPNRVPRSSTAPVAMVKPSFLTNNNSSVEHNVSVVSTNAMAPALPPLNPGSHARPLISSPILKASTCTAKELISPLKSAPKVPTRPAPDAPHEARPLSSPVNPTVSIILEEMEKQNRVKENSSTLNRITSFLKPKDDKKVTGNEKMKLNKTLGKDKLRSIEISNPIPQTEIAIKANDLVVEEKKNVVMRAQSMRGNNVTPRPNIQTFGSMRQPGGAKRPTSIPVGNRPKSPPPPRPPLPEIEKNIVNKIPGMPGYQEPAKTKSISAEYQYDDCLNESPLAKISEESPNGDNIYAVIEETPKSPLADGKSNSNSSESVGLLGEIVSEIQQRNFDSIYSTSTLARKKKEAERSKQAQSAGDNSENYVNTSSLYKTPDNLYSNMGNVNQSSASSTASGYIHPSAVNKPQNVVVNVSDRVKSPLSNLSTFKSDKPMISGYKPYHSTFQRNAGPFASSFKCSNNQSVVITSATNDTAYLINTTTAKNTVSPVTVSTFNCSTPVTTSLNPPLTIITTTSTTTNSTFKSSLTNQAALKFTPLSSTASENSTLKCPPPPSGNVITSTFKSAPLTSTVSSTLKSTPLTNIVTAATGPKPNTTTTNTVIVTKPSPAVKAPVSPITKKTESESKIKSPSLVSSPTSKTPRPIGRQVTPVNLRTRKPSPVRTSKHNTKPSTTSNSPDLVISCSTTTTSTKSPDVLNSSAKLNNKLIGVLPKPAVTPKVAAKTMKSPTERKAVGKNPLADKTKTKLNYVNSSDSKSSASAKLPVKTQPSTVAALQQKFENKNQTAKTK